jgi:endonuclease YncB( thermonuclease family)
MTALSTIEHAVELAKSGDRNAAQLLVIEILKSNPNYVEAWLLAAKLADDPEQRDHALQQVLTLQPDNAWAAQQLHQSRNSAEANMDASSEHEMEHKTQADISASHQRVAKQRSVLLRVGGIALAGIVVIVLGVMLVLSLLSPGQHSAVSNNLPTLITETQTNMPASPQSNETSTPDLATEAVNAATVPTDAPNPVTSEATSSEEETAVVVQVIDGDTIEVKLDGKIVTVRYLGIRVAEMDEECGKQASDFNASLVEGQTVRLVREVSDTDSEGRLLRHVYVGSLFVSAELLAKGYALAAIVPPDVAQAGNFASLEQQAHESKVGCVFDALMPPGGDRPPGAKDITPGDVTPVGTEAGPQGQSTPPGAGNGSGPAESTPTTDSSGPPNFPTSTP